METRQIMAPSVGDLETLIPSFRRHLRVANLSPRTVRATVTRVCNPGKRHLRKRNKRIQTMLGAEVSATG
jgi:hypothetical protein